MTDLDLTRLGGQFTGARMGQCRTCRDLTVLPAFGDGRCFGCTTDEIGETQWVPQKQILFHESEVLVVHQDILEIFDEAQRSVPAYKVIAGLAGPNGSISIRRHGLWLPKNARWEGLKPVSARVAEELGEREAINGYYKDLRKCHAAKGLCVLCTNEAIAGKTLCEKHMARVTAKYLDRKATGVCLGCGGERDTEHGTCTSCIAKRTRSQATRAERLLAAGLCTACGKRPAAPKWCVECREKRNAKRRTGHRLTPEQRADSARRANAARWGRTIVPIAPPPLPEGGMS